MLQARVFALRVLHLALGSHFQAQVSWPSSSLRQGTHVCMRILLKCGRRAAVHMGDTE
jgi:hypothetical protein